MKFTHEQIEIARRLKRLELPWTPSVGHYVFDEHRICPKSSPFQERVYFLLNFDCFMSHVGGLERFREDMIWLPTWHDCREILHRLGVSHEEIAMLIPAAISRNDELTELYKMIENALQQTTESTHRSAGKSIS